MQHLSSIPKEGNPELVGTGSGTKKMRQDYLEMLLEGKEKGGGGNYVAVC